MLIIKILQKLLNVFGFQIISKRSPEYFKDTIPEIHNSDQKLISECIKYSSNSADLAMWSLINSVKYILQNNIKGDFVECGVFRGGNVILMQKLLDKFNVKKKIYAYDTYEGMPLPTSLDIDIEGNKASHRLDDAVKENNTKNVWCYSELNDVKNNILKSCKNNYVIPIKGMVEDTLKVKSNLPKNISLLRLDTDFYSSTLVELKKLYPRLSKGGILIIDDYGYWRGARKAVDEYFKDKKILMHRIDFSVRLIVKN
jgi:O-methyltransferase